MLNFTEISKQRIVENANFRQDPHREDNHPRGRALRLHRERQGQDPGKISLTEIS